MFFPLQDMKMCLRSNRHLVQYVFVCIIKFGDGHNATKYDAVYVVCWYQSCASRVTRYVQKQYDIKSLL